MKIQAIKEKTVKNKASLKDYQNAYEEILKSKCIK